MNSSDATMKSSGLSRSPWVIPLSILRWKCCLRFLFYSILELRLAVVFLPSVSSIFFFTNFRFIGSKVLVKSINMT